MLRRGNAGRARVPGKHGAAPAVYETVAVLISDQPGELARIFADAGRAGVNIEDVRIEHATGQQAGLVQLMVDPSAAPALAAALRERDGALRTGPAAERTASARLPAALASRRTRPARGPRWRT